MRPVYLQAIFQILLCFIFYAWLPGVLLVVNAQEENGEGVAAAEVQLPAGVNPAEEDAKLEVDPAHEKEVVQAVESESETQVCSLSVGSNIIYVCAVHPLMPVHSIQSLIVRGTCISLSFISQTAGSCGDRRDSEMGQCWLRSCLHLFLLCHHCV